MGARVDYSQELRVALEAADKASAYLKDAYAAFSHLKAAKATNEGHFRDEIVPVSVTQKGREAIVISRDESIRPDTTPESLATLKPAFAERGTVTAGNAPGVKVSQPNGRLSKTTFPNTPRFTWLVSRGEDVNHFSLTPAQSQSKA